MGVSFQTPTRIAPEQVASAVRGHEQEHVVREQAMSALTGVTGATGWTGVSGEAERRAVQTPPER